MYLTSASAMRTLSSCRLSLMRALLFFSTSGFLVCHNSKTVVSPVNNIYVGFKWSGHSSYLSVRLDSTVTPLHSVCVVADGSHIAEVRAGDYSEEPLEPVTGDRWSCVSNGSSPRMGACAQRICGPIYMWMSDLWARRARTPCHEGSLKLIHQ